MKPSHHFVLCLLCHVSATRAALATDDDSVTILHGGNIQTILKDDFDATCSLNGVYRLLHRLNYSWLVPRPQHEKADATPHDEMYQSVDQVPQRCLGIFAGWPSANDWYTGGHHVRNYYPEYPGQTIMQCCMGNAARTIYYAWQRSVDYRDGRLRVNLLLNRASPWADVDSYIPYEGRVDIRVKQPCELSLRIPEWVSPSQTRCQVNDASRSCRWDGRYVCLGAVRPGDIAAISFPITLQTEDINVQGSYYKIVRKGNDVLLIDPPGKYCPFYQRAHYRADSVRWKKATRFVADKLIEW